MAEINDVDHIKQQATRGILFLSCRNFALQIISLLGFFVLTIILGTAEVGLFAIVAELVGILAYFSDLGLASALIQKRRSVTQRELRTVFLIQQILSFLAVAAISLVYPTISNIRHYGPKEFWIFVSLCYSFVAASLKTIPSVLLERQLNFKFISTVDIIENLTFYLVAVILALLNFGVYAYAYAAFVRSTIGLFLVYRLSPWPFGVDFYLPAIKLLFKFGIPFQLNSFISLAKDRLSNLVVAGILGRESFGLLSWAQKGPRLPLSFMDSVIRVTFPTFSRLQHRPQILAKSLQKTIYYISLIIFPLIIGIALIAKDFVNVIPKYQKWFPALIPLYFYSASFLLASVTTPITNAFNSVGKIIITTKLMIAWTILTWLFYPILTTKYGYLGTSIASLMVGLSSIYVWYLSWSYFRFNLITTIAPVLISSLLIITASLLINFLHLSSLSSLLLKILVCPLLYFIYHFTFSRKEIFWIFRQITCIYNRK